jgi:hypothetical protein
VRFPDIDLHIGKSCSPEALWKCVWVYYYHCVEEVKQTKRTAVEAVRALISRRPQQVFQDGTAPVN